MPQNHAYVALEPDDLRTARDVLAEAVNRDWADIPATVYRAQLEPSLPAGCPAQSVPRPPLDPEALRRLAGELQRIDQLAVPFWRGELQRDLDHAARHRASHAAARATVEAAKSRRDQIGERLGELSPWNPFNSHERKHLEAANRQAQRDVARGRHAVQETGQQLAAAEDKAAWRQAWLDRHQPDHDRRPELQTAIDRDLRARIQQAGEKPAPLWAVHTLGDRPHQPDLAAVWDQAVGEVNQYRAIHAISDIDEPLGPHPARLQRQHDAWTAAASSLDHAAQQLGLADQLNRHLHHDLDHDGLGISR